ncbi:MAG TPA: CHAP domain-containing protein [Acetobacteraceae bacterium]|nr:CHAP domain-containing protein [Acetobacteraceae bacterium]
MRGWRTGTNTWLIGSALLLSCPLLLSTTEADAQTHHRSGRAPTEHYTHASTQGASHAIQRSTRHVAYHAKSQHGRRVTRSYGISCVPYAKMVSGIAIAGNAWQWWDNAAGHYARGARPEPGSVLAFRSNHRMPLGHVAVVDRVVNAREIIIDHANWPSPGMRNGVSHDVAVVDVSEANDWTAVRVELGHGGDFGAVYPTHGFIYDRPDAGVITASVTRPTPQRDLNPAPNDLRPAAERPWRTYEEVAEAPATVPHRTTTTLAASSPARR